MGRLNHWISDVHAFHTRITSRNTVLQYNVIMKMNHDYLSHFEMLNCDLSILGLGMFGYFIYLKIENEHRNI